MKCADLYTERDAHNLKVFNIWCIAAALAFAGSTMAMSPKFLDLRGPLAVLAVAVTIALLCGTIVVFLRFIREADELLRKIQLDALGAAFGAGTVFMLGYRLCERLGAPRLDVDDAFVVMMLIWSLAQYLGHRRYSGGEVEA